MIKQQGRPDRNSSIMSLGVRKSYAAWYTQAHGWRVHLSQHTAAERGTGVGEHVLGHAETEGTGNKRRGECHSKGAE